MASRKACIRSAAGFTLIETLVVVGVLSILVSFSLFVDLNNYRGTAFRAERTVIVTLLQTARAQALNNVDQSPHGVALRPDGYDGYVGFAGATYASRDAGKDVLIPASYPADLEDGSPREISFCQLSGDAIADGNGACGDGAHRAVSVITLRDPERRMTSDISINHEGAISW